MKLFVIRYAHGENSTLGLFLIENKFYVYTLEDAFHVVKIPGETRIPNGTYKVILRNYGGHHQRYKVKFPDIHKGMLQVMDVPNYTDILIHIGNDEDDTEGCLLVGDKSITNIQSSGRIESSTIAYKRIYPIIANAIDSGEEVTITYKDLEPYV
jgi:hypothetical protein